MGKGQTFQQIMLGKLHFYIEKNKLNFGWIAMLVRELSQFFKVAGLIPDQGTYKNQPRNA